MELPAGKSQRSHLADCSSSLYEAFDLSDWVSGHLLAESKQGRSTSKALVNRPKAGSLAASLTAGSSNLVRIGSGRSEQPDSLNSMESTWPQFFELPALSQWISTAPNPEFEGSAAKEGRPSQPIKPAAEALHESLISKFCGTLYLVGWMPEQDRNLKVNR